MVTDRLLGVFAVSPLVVVGVVALIAQPALEAPTGLILLTLASGVIAALLLASTFRRLRHADHPTGRNARWLKRLIISASSLFCVALALLGRVVWLARGDSLRLDQDAVPVVMFVFALASVVLLLIARTMEAAARSA